MIFIDIISSPVLTTNIQVKRLNRAHVHQFVNILEAQTIGNLISSFQVDYTNKMNCIIPKRN